VDGEGKLPKAEAEPERYQGRPLLIVLESYVLAAIGELPSGKDRALAKVVQRVFGGGEDWMLTVRQRLELPDTLDEELRRLWARNRRVARDGGVELLPVQFAKMVADENFASLLGEPPK
jgi:hypothetical protein